MINGFRGRPGSPRPWRAAVASIFLMIAASATAATPQPSDAVAAEAKAEYDWRAVDIPMRDGVTLRTIIVTPNGARGAPIVLNRTPFGAANRVKTAEPRLENALSAVYRPLARRGYIVVYQDIRGSGESGGEFVVTRPPVGPYNSSKTDESTDAWDTIDWLVKNVPASNGNVGVIGASYDGFTTLMALRNPHPALKAAVPINALVDGWRGDDWFHNGAFRQVTMTFAFYLDGPVEAGAAWPTTHKDDFDALLAAGSAGAYAKAAGLDKSPFWKRVTEHPAYDGHWRGIAMGRLLAEEKTSTPTLHVASLFDAEDTHGPFQAYAALEKKDRGNDRNFLIVGPWNHRQPGGDGSNTGPLAWSENTSLRFRETLLPAFLDRWLKADATAATVPPVTAFETGTGAWRTHAAWPATGSAKPRAFYLGEGGRLSASAPGRSAKGWDEYVSDPANPVPYSPRPTMIVTEVAESFDDWLVEDQRLASRRPDVLTYVTEPLSEEVRISGAPIANLVASTSGTDSDWVVKLIDVYPDDAPAMAGYQLPIAMEIFRGRYRAGLDKPRALTPDRPERYRFALPTANHVFRPGHRIMVQIQSSWFPLYDRNPQTYVDNIFFAPPEAYRAARQRIHRSSFVELPIATPVTAALAPGK